MRLPLTQLRASYRVTQALRMPFYSGSMFRGVFGRALRALSCLQAGGCPGACERGMECGYTRLFDPPLPDPVPHKLLHGATRAPAPLVPTFPPHGLRDLDVGDRLWLDMTVLGQRTSEELFAVRRALVRVGEMELEGRGGAGRAELDGLELRGSPGEELVVEAASPADRRPGRVRVELRSPLWLVQGDKLVRKLDFPLLFRAISRRVTTLAALYGSPGPDDEGTFAALDALAPEVQIVESHLRPEFWERYAATRDRQEPMRGLVGTFVAEGPVFAFEPWLRAAEKVHLGKETTFGLGAVRVRWGAAGE